jgi:TRAP-type C4-dicarboxylate transport system permease small subunit
VKRFVEATAATLRWSLIAAVALMFVCIAVQVVMRYVFGNALSWSEELALLMFSWAALGGLALGVHEGFHVRLTLILDPLPAGARAWAVRAIELLTAASGAYLVWSGWRYVDITRGGTSAAIAYPIELLHGIAPLAGLFVVIFAVERLLFSKAA